MRKFLTAAALALHFGPAVATAGGTTNSDFDTAKGTYQTADIGNYYDDLTPSYPNNKLIQDIDDIFQRLLSELWAAEEQYLRETDEEPKEYYSDTDLPETFRRLYHGYADDLKALSGMLERGTPFGTVIDERLEICKSIEAEVFLEVYLSRFSNYAHENYDLSPEFSQDLNAIRRLLEELRDTNQKELDRLEEHNKSPQCTIATARANSLTPYFG